MASYHTYELKTDDGLLIAEIDCQLDYDRRAHRFVGVAVDVVASKRKFVAPPAWLKAAILADCNKDAALLAEYEAAAEAEHRQEYADTLRDAARDEAVSRELCGG